MNAPISAALLQLRAAAPADDGLSQPLIPAAAKLLKSRFEHNGLLVDLYGDFDASGYEVQHVGLHASLDRADLGVWLDKAVLLQLSAWCNRRLPSTEELLLASQQEDRAERHLWMRRAAQQA